MNNGPFSRRWQLGLGVVLAALAGLGWWTTAQAATAGPAPSLRLTDATGEYHLGPYLEVLEDPTRRLTVDVVTAADYSARFRPSQAAVPDFTPTLSAYWVRVRVRNATAATSEWRLEYPAPTMNYISLYVFTPGEAGFASRVTGDLLPYDTRDVATAHFVFKLVIPPGAERVLYLRFANEGSMSLPLILWSLEAYLEQAQMEGTLTGLLYGAQLIILLYHLALYALLREVSDLDFAVFILIFLLSQLVNDGLGQRFFWPHTGFGSRPGLLFAGLLGLMTLRFTSSFLNTQRHLPGWHRLIVWQAVPWLGFVAGVMFAPLGLSAPLFLALLLMNIALTTGPSLLMWRRGYRPARYYAIAWLAPAVGVVVYILARFSLLPSNALTEHGYQVGAVLLVLILSLAVAERITLLRREKSAAQTAVLYEQTNALRLKDELNAALMQANTELSIQVEERARIETALRESEARYRRVAENAPDILFRFALAPELRLEFVSAAVERVTGYTAAAFFQDPALYLRLIHPEDQAILTNMIRAPRTQTLQLLRWVRKDGQVIWTEQHIVPVYDAANQLVAMEGIARDVTRRKTMETALRESEERFRALAEQLPGVVYICRDNDRLTMLYLNDAVEALTGYPKDEFLLDRLSFQDLYHPEDQPEVRRGGETVVGRPGFRQQYRIRHASGAWRWVEEWGTRVELPTGDHVLEGFMLDISARKDLEAQELRRRELVARVAEYGKRVTQVTDLPRTLLRIHEAIRTGLGFDRVGIFLYEAETRQMRGTLGVDLHGAITEEWNTQISTVDDPAFAHLLRSPEDYLYCEDYASQYTPPTGSVMTGVHAHVLVTARAGDRLVGAIGVDNVLTQRPIEPAQVEALRLFAGYVGLAIENTRLFAETQQRLAEQTQLYEFSRELAEAPDRQAVIHRVVERMALYLDALSVAYWDFDERLNQLTFVQAYDPTGAVTPTMASARLALEDFPQIAAVRWAQQPRVFAADDITLNTRQRQLLRFGPNQALVVVPVLIRDRCLGCLEIHDQAEAAGQYEPRLLRLLSALAMQAAVKLENLTLVARLEQSVLRANELAGAAESANRLKSEILANTSHELRTPLTTIQGSLSLVLDNVLESREDETVWLRTAYTASESLLGMINTLIDVAKLEAHQLVLLEGEVDLGWLLREIIGLVRADAEAKGLALKLVLAEGLAPVWTDRDRVRQILLSLVRNAIKFTDTGAVTIRLAVAEGWVEIQVEDTGIGMSREVLGRVFEPFVQGDAGTTRRHGGTGLGLYIARKLAEYLSGAVEVFSPGEGQGTTAVLRLPLRQGGGPTQRETLWTVIREAQ